MTDQEMRDTLRQAMKDWDNATPAQRAAATGGSVWADAEIISQYTRSDAINDGVLIDANIGDCDEVSRQHFPNARVAMTVSVLGLIQKAVDHPRWCNDWRGVWHDVCFMSRAPFRTADGLFLVIITGTGRVRRHVLRRVDSHDVDGTPTVTFMLRGED